MRLAAVAAEDQKFPRHWGFDFESIADAVAHPGRRGRLRGASTITQQVARNLFLRRLSVRDPSPFVRERAAWIEAQMAQLGGPAALRGL
jgi:membrane peptidoglycan carboxypeptidase